jgi:hypothetical protein
MLATARRPSRPRPLLICMLTLALALLAAAAAAAYGRGHASAAARAHGGPHVSRRHARAAHRQAGRQGQRQAGRQGQRQAGRHGRRDGARQGGRHGARHAARLSRIARASRFRSGGVLTDPINPKYLTELPYGTRSDWIQPWRAYMSTWPAARLTDSLGINFNVDAAQAEDTAQLLQESGFTLARIEIGWNSLSYASPTQFRDEADVDARLEALRRHGLRPLILLNANSGEPNPTEGVRLETTEAAPAGARTVTLTPKSAAQVLPGRTGFDGLAFGGTPDLLITSISGETATLSEPLPNALPAGEHNGATLLYEPFGPPKLPDGQPNPAFQETLSGWLSYVGTIARKAASIFGPNGYDLEVWNELSFGSQYLNEENYYSPAREAGGGSVTQALLEATVAYIRNPASGIGAGVGVSDGFASENPLVSGATVPKGTTALSKHLYQNGVYLPSGEAHSPSTPLNALGLAQPKPGTTSAHGARAGGFQPVFHAELPEYFLTGLEDGTVVRDLSPFTTRIDGVPYGRQTHPAGGAPPQVWMTEYNLEHNDMHAEPAGAPGHWEAELTPAQLEHVQAEIALRSLVSMVGKGMSREYFYAVTGQGWNLVSEAFMSAVSADPGSYPGSALGGETVQSFHRLMGQFQGPGPRGGAARQLSLLSIAQDGNHAQFRGNGSPANPSLYDRDMLAVLPFQSSPRRFAIPIYVMSENFVTVEKPGEPQSSPYRFDLPGERFRITLGNLPASRRPPRVSAYDPIRGRSTPARLVAREGHEAVFEIAATNYPRVLEVEYAGR